MAVLRWILSLLLAAVSGYALLHSSSSIPKLRKYEPKAEKAAEWSSTAEKRLWDTRYTVGAGVIAAAVSLLSAVSAVFSPNTGVWAVAWPLGLAFGEIYAARYMRSFWADKGKVPLMDEYNDAISDTIEVINLLNVLAMGWGVMGLLFVIGY